jgi:hypothetical protein
MCTARIIPLISNLFRQEVYTHGRISVRYGRPQCCVDPRTISSGAVIRVVISTPAFAIWSRSRRAASAPISWCRIRTEVRGGWTMSINGMSLCPTTETSSGQESPRAPNSWYRPSAKRSWLCRNFWLRTERSERGSYSLMRRAARTAQRVTVAECRRISPVPFASCAPFRCRPGSRERY